MRWEPVMFYVHVAIALLMWTLAVFFCLKSEGGDLWAVFAAMDLFLFVLNAAFAVFCLRLWHRRIVRECNSQHHQ